MNDFKINMKDFKRLSKWLYILPDLLPKREIDKFQNIWVEAYGYSIPTEVIAKSDINLKELMKMDIRDALGRKSGKYGRKRRTDKKRRY